MAVVDRQKQELPAEVWDHVLDYLREDKRTLKRCSLVCKSWVYSSHRHLFRTVKIHGRDQVAAIHVAESLFCATPSKVPNISNYVQELAFSHGYQGLNIHILRKVLLALPNIRKLVLKAYGIIVLNQMENEAPPDLKLSTLHIEHGGCEGLLTLLTLFHSIDHLVISGNFRDIVRWGIQPHSVPQPGLAIKAISLTDIDHDDATMSSVLRLVKQAQVASCLMSLSILSDCVRSWSDVGTMENLLQLLVPMGTLRHLAFMPAYSYRPAWKADIVRDGRWSSFAQCASLEWLDLYFDLDYKDTLANHAINELFLPMLERVAAPLHTVVLRAVSRYRYQSPFSTRRRRDGPYAVVVPSDVEVLDAAFRRPNLMQTRVVFDYSDADPPLAPGVLAVAREFLEESLPFVASGNRLVVTDVPCRWPGSESS